MEQSEIDKAVGDLEMRVDRLRSLYDQYFMGIERIPPAVSHKDVERRIQMMRKEQIRNTGLRFRFQMLIQRYNTYQSYWLRITRQIEEGTYKRDVVRAKKRIEKTERARLSEAPESIEVFVSEPPPALEDEPATTKLTRPDAIKLELDDDFKELGGKPRAEAPKPAAPKVPPAAGSKPVVPVAPPSVSIPGARPIWRKVGEGTSAAPPALKHAPAATMTVKPAAPAVSIKPAVPAVSIKPAAPAVSRPPPVPTRPSAAAPPQPAPSPPAAKPQPAPPPPAAKPQPAAPTPPAAVAKKPGDISEDRMRQLYSDFVETKRSQKESTASVTYDALARTIRDSTAKLKEKHAGRSVDFEVTVKDGKTILKPVVK